MNFGDLKTYVEDVLGRTDIPEAAYVLAQDDWARRLRLQGDQATATLSAPYALPADFLSTVEVRFNGYRLDAVTALPDGVTGGNPDRYRVSGGFIEPWPVTTGDITIVYNRKPAVMVNAGDTSDVLTRFANVAIYGSLYHCCTLIRDIEGRNTFEPMYVTAVNEAIAEDVRTRFSGGSMIPSPREVA